MDSHEQLSVDWKVRFKGLLMVAVPVAALVALTISVQVLQSERRLAEDRLYRTVQLHREVQRMQSELLGADTAIRGYLLQGEDELQGPFKAARESLPARLENLDRLLSSNHVQLARLREVKPLVARHLEILSSLRQYAAIPGMSPPSPPEPVLADQTASLGRILSILRELQREEDTHTQRAYGEAHEARQRGDMIVLGTLAFGLLGGIGAAWMLMSRLVSSERRRAERAVQQSHDQLQQMLGRAEAQAVELACSEADLRHQTGVLQSVLHSMSDGVVVVGNDGVQILCNQTAGRILDRLPETPIAEWVSRYGLSLSDGTTGCAPDDLPLTKALRGEAVDHAVLFASRAREGEGVWISMTARPMQEDSGAVTGAVMVLNDITEHKRRDEALSRAKEEAERANCAKSDFLSRMSHELRTPLNAILGFAQLLEMARLKGLHRDHVAQILKAGRHLLTLINEVLDISRIESGRLALSPEPVMVAELLRETLAMVQPQAARMQVRVQVDEEPAGAYVLADQQRLKQVLLNLLSNAVKYNRIGGSMNVRCERTPEGRVRINVSDTGLGIPPEKIALLFNPFERLGAEQTEVEGTGIGLVLSKRLVEVMDGTIGIVSQVNVGTTFWVELPPASPPADDLDLNCSQGLIAAAGAVAGAQGPAVLCIEDNPSNLRLVERIMALRPGVRLLTALTGGEGLEIARQRLPNLVLLDVHLPDIDGKDVLVQLRADPRTAHIPVVVVSADATPRQEQRLRKAGALDYLTKPLDVQKLLAVVEETLEHADAL